VRHRVGSVSLRIVADTVRVGRFPQRRTFRGWSGSIGSRCPAKLCVSATRIPKTTLADPKACRCRIPCVVGPDSIVRRRGFLARAVRDQQHFRDFIIRFALTTYRSTTWTATRALVLLPFVNGGNTRQCRRGNRGWRWASSVQLVCRYAAWTHPHSQIAWTVWARPNVPVSDGGISERIADICFGRRRCNATRVASAAVGLQADVSLPSLGTVPWNIRRRFEDDRPKPPMFVSSLREEAAPTSPSGSAAPRFPRGERFQVLPGASGL